MPKAYSYVRMSTPEQLKGDSKRRQLAKTQQFAAEHGLEIVERFDDIGISAFRGENTEVGALQRFNSLVASGEIERGSYLIVESMDRLSRQEVMRALEYLTAIVNKGIVLVTLDDGQVYSEQSLQQNYLTLVIALAAMSRAHGESKRKSGMLAEVWGEKKRKAREYGEALTRRVPGWLELDPQSGKVVAIPHRVQVVREIFDLVRGGWGAYSVARLLNERREPVWSARKNAVWRESYIKKIVRSRAVIGEYQPHRTAFRADRTRARIPEGPPVQGYYPAILPETLLHEAALAMSRRRVIGRGRKGSRMGNLLTGLLKCVCTAGYRFIDKGQPPKGGKYLQCSVAYSKGACGAPPFPYEVVEEVVLGAFESLDIGRVLGEDAKNRRLASLNHDLAMLRLDVKSLSEKLERVVEAIAGDVHANRTRLGREAKSLELQRSTKANEVDELERQIGELLSADPEKRKVEIAALIARIRSSEGDVELVRRSLSGEFQRYLIEIVLQPIRHVVWEFIDENPDWKEKIEVRNQGELERLLKAHGFELTLKYRNGDVHSVSALGGVFSRIKGSRRLMDLRFSQDP